MAGAKGTETLKIAVAITLGIVIIIDIRIDFPSRSGQRPLLNKGDFYETIVIQANDANQRLDKFLTKSFPNLPQSMLYKSIRKKDIKCNGKRCEISTRLQEGDVLTLYLKDEFFQKEPKEHDFLKAPKKLTIVYEDENILLLDKKPGLIVHPDEHYHFDSLIARVQHYLYDKGEYDPEAENSFAPALVNRIDRNTGGIVMAAKNAEALRILNEKLRVRELTKKYLCIVCGRMPKKRTRWRAFWKRTKARTGIYFPKSQRQHPEHPHPVSGSCGKEGIFPAGSRTAHRAHPSDPGSHGIHRAPAGR